MLDPSFVFSDLPKVALLAFLELLLSADNAVVLGLLTHRLPEHLRKKALFIGVASAFVLRALALIAASFLLQHRWLQALGGAYLLYIAFHHLRSKKTTQNVPKARSFWGVVALIELFDLAFAIDSIIAGVAFINSDPSKLWIVYVGGMIGLLGTRWAASLFSQMLVRFPQLEKSAYLLVGWVGLKLVGYSFGWVLPASIFWIVALLLLGLGLMRKKWI